MQSNNFYRLCGSIRQGIWRSVSGKEIGIQDQLDALIDQGKLLLGHSRLLHHWSSETFTDLHVLVRPSTVASAQANLCLANQQNNLSVVGAFSRTLAIPSVSGPSFQVCRYHIDSLLAEPNQVSGINSCKAVMAVCGSRSAITNNTIGNSALLPAQPGLTAYQSFSAYSKSSFVENSTKSPMSLRNKEQPNELLLYGYFIYNIAKRKGNHRPYIEFNLNAFHTLSQPYSSAGMVPEVSINHSPREELQSGSRDSSELNIPIDHTLKLNSASCYLPHPDKEETGGEDAHFICTDEQAIGVADGVGGWADLGVDAGQYARELMSNSVNAVEEEPRGSIDPARVLEKAYVRTKSKGSSTACIIALTDRGLHAINLGDSGFMVIRDGCTVFRSPAQQHDFNFTYQLESGNSGDLPSSGQVFTIPVAPRDVIIAGTDGLFDNLYNSDITAVVVHATRAGIGPLATAQKIAALARQRAQDRNRQTPFSTAAQEAGFRYYGGKLDDITVVVSYITKDHSENSSAKNRN